MAISQTELIGYSSEDIVFRDNATRNQNVKSCLIVGLNRL
jgi:hypothetical protein